MVSARSRKRPQRQLAALIAVAELLALNHPDSLALDALADLGE